MHISTLKLILKHFIFHIHHLVNYPGMNFVDIPSSLTLPNEMDFSQSLAHMCTVKRTLYLFDFILHIWKNTVDIRQYPCQFKMDCLPYQKTINTADIYRSIFWCKIMRHEYLNDMVSVYHVVFSELFWRDFCSFELSRAIRDFIDWSFGYNCFVRSLLNWTTTIVDIRFSPHFCPHMWHHIHMHRMRRL